jgi:hypothetical protein
MDRYPEYSYEVLDTPEDQQLAFQSQMLELGDDEAYADEQSQSMDQTQVFSDSMRDAFDASDDDEL